MPLTLWINKFILKHLIGMKCNNDKNKNLYFRIFEIFHIFNQIFFWFYTKNLACRVLKFLRQKCIVLKFLNPKFQLLNLRKWWFYVGLKPWHYLWDTLYLIFSIIFFFNYLIINIGGRLGGDRSLNTQRGVLDFANSLRLVAKTYPVSGN